MAIDPPSPQNLNDWAKDFDQIAVDIAKVFPDQATRLKIYAQGSRNWASIGPFIVAPAPVTPKIIKITVGSDSNGQRIDFDTDSPIKTYGRTNSPPWESELQDPARRTFDLTYLAPNADIPIKVTWTDGTTTNRTVHTGGSVVTPPVDPPVDPPATGKLSAAWGGYSDKGSTGLFDFEKRSGIRCNYVVLMQDESGPYASGSGYWAGFDPAGSGPPFTAAQLGNRKLIIATRGAWRGGKGAKAPGVDQPAQDLVDGLADPSHITQIDYLYGLLKAMGLPKRSVIIRQQHEQGNDWYPDSVHYRRNTPALYKQSWNRLQDHWWEIDTAELIDGFEFCTECNSTVTDRSAYYPGDDRVKYTGPDCYLGGDFNSWKNDLAAQVKFAIDHGKGFAISEFGGAIPGYGDNVDIFKQFMTIVLSSPLHHFCWFDSNQGGVHSWGNFPKIEAEIKRLIGA